MTWLAIIDPDQARLNLHGLGQQSAPTPQIENHPDTLVTRGTLLFETHPAAEQDQPEPLFGFSAQEPWARSLCFSALPGGGIKLALRNADSTRAARARRMDEVRRDVLRVSYSWDSLAKWGRLTLEQPEECHLVSVPVPQPPPLRLEDLRTLFTGGRGRIFAPQMIFAAWSSRVEPVGPTPSLIQSTPIATPWGYRALGDLQRGDTVTTQGSGIVPILHSVSRTMPARGSYAPIRIRAPYFGLVQDILVAPEQRLLIDGPEVEYLFGQEAVLVPARHLVNGFNAHPEPCGPVVTYSQLLLPRHETLLGAGSALESLYIGRIRRRPADLNASLLRDLDRNGLPEHGRPSHQVLRQYEAIHLARRRAA